MIDDPPIEARKPTASRKERKKKIGNDHLLTVIMPDGIRQRSFPFFFHFLFWLLA